MGQIKWYKRDPSAALNGMMELSLEERGAYNTVLDLIYSRDGKLVDDDRFIAGWLRVDVRIWRRIKGTLIDRGKLFVEAGLLRNPKADEEVLSALSRVASARDAGLMSAHARAAKSDGESNKNSDIATTDVGPTDPTPASTNYNHNHKVREEEETNVSPSSARARSAAAPVKPKSKPKTDEHPLPEGWEPLLTPRVQAIVDVWPETMFEYQRMKFENHAAMHGRLAKDWQAAFRIWIINAEEMRVERSTQAGRGRRPVPDTDPRDGFERALDDNIWGPDGPPRRQAAGSG